MNIQDIMSSPALTCGASDSLNDAARVMWEHDCGVVPVVNDEGRLVGIITDRDICMAAYTHGGAIGSIPISDAMAKQVYWCHADQSLEAAERLMKDKQIRRIPIVDKEHRPVGMVSLNDIARRAEVQAGDGLSRELTQTLQGICQPRSPYSQHASAE